MSKYDSFPSERMKRAETTMRSRSLAALAQLKSKFITPLKFQSPSIRRFSSSTDPSQFQCVGFIGLGNMGSRMANNLIKAGHNIAVHDVNLNAIKMFSEKGILIKDSPSEVAETCDVVITMLPSSSHVLDVYTGPNGILHSGNQVKPWLFIDSSTIDPQTTRKLSAAISSCTLKEKKAWAEVVSDDIILMLVEGSHLLHRNIIAGSTRLLQHPWIVPSDSLENPLMLDAPVSGGVLAAENGTLTFMVGGSEEACVAAKPLFSSMGKNTIYCGGAGTGSAAKICNNLAMAVSMLGASEAFVLGQSLGIAASTLTKIFNSSSARSWSSDTYNPVPGVMDGVPSSRNYEGGFASNLMAKDLNLAALSANEVGLKCPLTSQAQEIFPNLCNDGHGSKDFSGVFRHYYNGADEV